MDQNIKDEMLYSLVYTQLYKYKRTFEEQKVKYTRETTEAWLQIIDNLFDLASAAAIRCKIPRASTNSLVRMVDEMRDFLERSVRK